jgi:hypothetical protein
VFNQLAACHDCAHECVCQDCTTGFRGRRERPLCHYRGKDLLLKWLLVKVQLYPNKSGSQERVTIPIVPENKIINQLEASVLLKPSSAFAPNETYINPPLSQESSTRRSIFCDTFLMAMIRTTNAFRYSQSPRDPHRRYLLNTRWNCIDRI